MRRCINIREMNAEINAGQKQVQKITLCHAFKKNKDIKNINKFLNLESIFYYHHYLLANFKYVK